MSEQYPLLPEFSDEDKLSPHYHRRRSLGLRGRAKYRLKGAAAIMSRWPDHWTTLLSYWWIALSMIAVTTFFIYNTLFSIVQLQPINTSPSKYASFEKITHTDKPSTSLAVHMHVFVNNNEIADLNKYIPYVEIFANKYKDLTFNLIVVANDTSEETYNCTDETKNALAMNSLFMNEANYGNLVTSNSNIKLKYETLSKYLNESPLQKHWKILPYHFIRFLVRAVSIWEKGGIAINPIILTPQSPHSTYVQKFGSIIKNFRTNKSRKRKHEKMVPKNKLNTKIIPPKVNNIRDIINALESGESDNPDQETLNAAESRTNYITADKNRKQSNILIPNDHEDYGNLVLATTKEAVNTDTNMSNEEHKSNSSSHLLPLFMNYIFHPRPDMASTNFSGTNTSSPKREQRSPTHKMNIDKDNNDTQMRHFWNDIKGPDSLKPMIVSAKIIPKSITSGNNTESTLNGDNLFELTVDLKGNIIATEIPCHAFVGNLFSNSIYHDSTESLTDFIIKELSLFCNGLLASCKGIDVILV